MLSIFFFSLPTHSVSVAAQLPHLLWNEKNFQQFSGDYFGDGNGNIDVVVDILSVNAEVSFE